MNEGVSLFYPYSGHISAQIKPDKVKILASDSEGRALFFFQVLTRNGFYVSPAFLPLLLPNSLLRKKYVPYKGNNRYLVCPSFTEDKQELCPKCGQTRSNLKRRPN
jgi:hypothetical protein